MTTLKNIIDSKKFDWVNPNITEENFPKQEIRKGGYKLFEFSEYISSEDAIKKMETEGYSPANIYELLEWKDWNEIDLVVALGSVGEVVGDRVVTYLDGGDSRRRVCLHWWNDAWVSDYRFLAVRNSALENSGTSELGDLESLTLENAIKICKENGLTITKTY